MKIRTVVKIVTLVFALITATVIIGMMSGCGGTKERPNGSTATGEATNIPARSFRAVRLTLFEKPTPEFRVPHYKTSGTFPQVSRRGMDLEAVNLSLREAIIEDQKEYTPAARREATTGNTRFDGVYRTSVDRHLISASSNTVSALIPITRLYPDGIDGQGWISVTALVPSGKTVAVSQLFTDPSRGLRVLAKAWLSRVRQNQSNTWKHCVGLYPSDYSPTAKHFRNFALIRNGLVVGFQQEPACFRSEAVVPYDVLRPYLSEFGKKLVAGVRSPA